VGPSISGTITSNGSGTGSYVSTLSGLTGSTQYYVRAYATNAIGTAYGAELSFSTAALAPQACPNTPTVTDVDGNIYNTVQIGTQCWTQSNLRVSKYRNGSTIPTGLNNSQWGSGTIGAYAVFNNNSTNDSIYGKLYNGQAVIDSRGLCPTGWRIPTASDFNTLIVYLDSTADTTCQSCWQSQFAGGELKALTLWHSPNSGASNSAGFHALPAGARDCSGSYISLGTLGAFMTSTNSGGRFANRKLFSNSAGYFAENGNSAGFTCNAFSVRCIKE
jgi:uncharacterized protein (TIGR02145 family)